MEILESNKVFHNNKERKMKKVIFRNFAILMFSLALSLVFVLDGFGQTVTPAQLEGVWYHPNGDSLNAKITFDGDSFSYTWALGSKNGNYTINRRSITFNADDGTTWTTNFTLNNDDLRLDQGRGGWHWYGTFLRSYPDVSINGTWRHPMREARGATFTFSGNNFTYSRNDGINHTGTVQRTDNRIILSVSGVPVREYTYRFTNNGLTLELFSVSGDGNTFYHGPFVKQ